LSFAKIKLFFKKNKANLIIRNIRLVKSYIKALLQEINAMDCNRSAILRVGSGKTIFENTIARIFDGQTLNKWMGKMRSGKGKEFPVSRVVALGEPNIEVCGWIKISLCEK